MSRGICIRSNNFDRFCYATYSSCIVSVTVGLRCVFLSLNRSISVILVLYIVMRTRQKSVIKFDTIISSFTSHTSFTLAFGTRNHPSTRAETFYQKGEFVSRYAGGLYLHRGKAKGTFKMLKETEVGAP